MMSVFKLHQALAVCDRLHGSGRSLNEMLAVKAEDMALETYSPLKDRYPNGGITLSVAELTEYTLKKATTSPATFSSTALFRPKKPMRLSATKPESTG